MGKAKSKRRRRRAAPESKKRGGVMMGMRTGFKGVAGAVAGEERSSKYKWAGRIITVLLIAAAVGLLLQRL
ncbi:hypothetical protein [Haliangium sp.]|uniref:hypothetical protein n=1 Tax=Haliangium sp. TaxID=2663208 RepID=UPI003D0D93C5